MTNNNDTQAPHAPAPIETHPWQPWMPPGAKVLIMGTFPPGSHRWAMDFYYPNRTNDFWRVMGIIYEGSADAFYDRTSRQYRLDDIKRMLTQHGIALSDTGRRIRRLKGNASDKFLEIVEPAPLLQLLAEMPDCRAVATTGEKAAQVVAQLTGTPLPAIGQPIDWTAPDGRTIRLWRLPSTSRAYPLAPEKKAEAYKAFLKDSGCC